MIIIGLLAVGMSVRFTADQRFARLSVNPKGCLFNTPWLPVSIEGIFSETPRRWRGGS